MSDKWTQIVQQIGWEVNTNLSAHWVRREEANTLAEWVRTEPTDSSA